MSEIPTATCWFQVHNTEERTKQVNNETGMNENYAIAYTPTADELKEVDYVADLSQYELDPTKTWEKVQYSLSQNGIGIAPLGDIHVVKAPQKNGKTFLLTLMMGAMLKGEYLGLKCEIEHPRLLFIDTEQHPRNTQLVYRRICRIAGIDGHVVHEQIRVLHMRGAQVAEIRHAILQEIVFYKPNVVYIDGLVDCVVDPNDQAESKAYITELSAIALRHNCSIWSVLHVNPGTEKMRGHLGTIMAQKVSDVLQCLKEKRPDGTIIFTTEQTDTRNKDINKFSFAIEDERGEDGEYLALPVQVYINVKEKTALDEVMQRVLSEKPLRGPDLITKLMDSENIKKTKAYDMKNEAERCGIIKIDSVTYCYRYVGLDMKDEDGCPF